MLLNKHLFTAVIFLIFLTSNVYAQTEEIKQIDSLVKWSYKVGIFNGNVLVSKNNKIIYNNSFGFTDASKTRQLTTDYRFNIGSITKEFSAVALMQLKEQGKLKLNDKISKYIPELPKWANEVTIKDLLNYTSGIPDVNWKNIQSDKDLFDGLKLIETLNFKSGENYEYNNNNIFLRHFIVERLTGMNYKAYVEKFIFQPCAMNSAVMTLFDNEENIAKGFSNDFVADKPDLPITGGTYLTTIDLLKWENCLCTEKIINKKSLYEIGQQFNLPETQSALGQAKYKNKKITEHIHDGRMGNYEALLTSNIDEKFTIILLDNNYNGKVFEISDSIVSILRHKKYILPEKRTN